MPLRKRFQFQMRVSANYCEKKDSINDLMRRAFRQAQTSQTLSDNFTLNIHCFKGIVKEINSVTLYK